MNDEDNHGGDLLSHLPALDDPLETRRGRYLGDSKKNPGQRLVHRVGSKLRGILASDLRDLFPAPE